ncbi:hypothetical protein PsYK624_082380 [Phanerochaete sordida]|uniref:Protein kinase domain-containing protein n=1 Tax=Phanerochaete sordida TaxID=48140 RepID=A0A9P3GE36_9APHY|nr:hypothetical protein PsYK624_082380 [Phanerochaete sordida]
MAHNESFLLGMPPHLFFDEFMDTEYEFEKSYTADFSKVPLGGSVQEMSARLIQAVERGDLCPKLQFFVPRMKKKQLKSKDGDRTLDLAPSVAVRRKPKSRRGQKKRKHHLEYLDFVNYTLGIELHEAAEADPWYDPDYLNISQTSTKSPLPAFEAPSSSHDRAAKPHSSASQNSPGCRKNRSPNKLSDAHICSGSLASVDKLTEGGRTLREALVSHATARFARQHQIFFFQLVLFGRYARLVRFDRSGCVVSDRIDYVEDPEVLSEFLWRFDQLNDEGRGHDSTVARATSREADLLRETVQALLEASKANPGDSTVVRQLPCAREALDATGAWPFWKIEVMNPITGLSSHLVVNKPLQTSSDLRGRNARAYIAYDIQKGRLVFMKDSWRSEKKGLRAEFQTYQELYACGVPHLPEVLCGGDVLDTTGSIHETVTQKFTYDDDGTRMKGLPELDRLVHHRIVQEIAYPLESALNEHEFIQALHDALQAIDKAYSSAGLLHRDISMNNIMLTTDGRGILNDWDHAGSKDDLCTGVGTWYFMSVALLRYPNTRRHDLVDDLQSVYWVLLYGAKRFVVGDITIAHQVFEQKVLGNDGCTMVGGGLKLACVVQNHIAGATFSTTALQDLVMRCSQHWSDYLEAVDKDPLPDDPETAAALDRAAQPRFWIDLFATALREAEESSESQTKAAVVAPPLAAPAAIEGSRGRGRQPKRKAEAEVEVDPPRRSKRIKVPRSLNR